MSKSTFKLFTQTGILLSILGLSLLGSRPTLAYFTTLDSGEIPAKERFRVSVAPQFIFNRYDGVNLVTQFDVPLEDGRSARGLLGFGSVDFQMGGFYKMVPFPDLDGQPAIGAMVGGIYSSIKGTNELSLRIHPLISKKIPTEVGDLIVYGSVPTGVTWRTGVETIVPVQAVLGTEARFLDWERFGFLAELGLNVTQSFSYFALGVSYEFDKSRIGQ